MDKAWCACWPVGKGPRGVVTIHRPTAWCSGSTSYDRPEDAESSAPLPHSAPVSSRRTASYVDTEGNVIRGDVTAVQKGRFVQTEEPTEPKRTEFGTIDMSYLTCDLCGKNVVAVQTRIYKGEPLTTWDCPDYMQHRETNEG